MKAALLFLALAAALRADGPVPVPAGSSWVLSVELQAGTPPFEYQWFRNGTLIEGANSSTLRLEKITGAETGGYSVGVSNAAGATMSPPEAITVELVPPQGASVKRSPIPEKPKP